MMFEKLADFIMKKAKLIIAIWIIVLLISVPFMLRYNEVLQYDMDKMSTSTPLESVQGQQMLNSGEFSSGGNLAAGIIIIVEVYDTIAADVASAVKDNLEQNIYFWDYNEQLRDKYGVDKEITVNQLGRIDDKYFADKETQMIIYTLSYPDVPMVNETKKSTYVPEIRTIVAESTEGVDGILGTYVTGTDAISYDTNTGSTNDIKHIDPVSILLVLILIGLFFRSFVTAGTPPIIIGMAYGILLALVYAIGSVLGIYYITTILVLVSMLGAGCDYCIFIVSRYREERKEGKDHDAALRESIIWAGESIITSGISVIIGFGSLMLCSFSLVSTLGMILALGIVLALLAALTFIPSILMLVGDRIFWPSKVSTYMDDSKAMQGWYGKMSRFGHRYFTHSAKSAIKYAKIIFIVTILLTVPLAYVVITSEPSYDMIGAMPNGEAKDGVAIISKNVGGGMLMPTNITMKVDAFVDLNINSNIASGDTIPSGGTVNFTATPHTGYYVKGWNISNTSGEKYYSAPGIYHDFVEVEISSLDSITVSGMDRSTTVTAVYDKLTYLVDFSSNDENMGTVSATSDGKAIIPGLEVDFANTLVFTASPKEGYHVDHWDVIRNGIADTLYSHDTELKIDRASYDYVIHAVFTEDTTTTYKVNFSAGEHGSIIVRADDEVINTGDSVAARAHITMSAVADSGYKVRLWKINEVDQTDDPTQTIPFLTENTTIYVEFESEPVEEYSVVFSSNDTNLGTVTVTANGDNIASGTNVLSGSKVVFTATPAEGYVVLGWRYNSTLIPITSYIDKKVHTIADLESDQDITVLFGEKVTDTVDVTTVDPANGTVYMTQNGAVISGTDVLVGSDLFLTAKVDDGYHITEWVITDSNPLSPQHIKTSSKNLSLYNVTSDTEVACVTENDDFICLYYGANNEQWGTLQVDCDEISIAYSERSNAAATYDKLNAFAQELMAMETDGENNVAMAIGPINGDILFDGDHEWIFDTVMGILPAEYRRILDTYLSGKAYDALIYTWDYVIPYQLKQMVNYYLTYKIGFVSDVFTDYEGGPEYQYVKFMVVTKDEPMSALSVDTIKQMYGMRDDFVAANSADNGGFVHAAFLSGAAVSNYEMSEMVNKDFHFIIVVVIVLLILLLFFVMRSYLTPIRAVATIVMSVVWTLGLTYLLFGHLLGMPVVWIVPIVLFVIRLGLGMDYDILLTTRIKECVTKGYTNDDAIVSAVQRSGAVITLCGLIMAGAFGTMMMSSSPMLMEFGFALGFAIAVDALVIRTYIVPAIMHLMGDWNWKGPNYGAIKNKLLRRKAEE